MLELFFVLVFGTFLFVLINIVNSKSSPKKDIVTTTVTSVPNTIFSTGNIVPSKMDLNEIYKDIYLEPYGCFSSLEEKFFQEQVNKYSEESLIDSGIILSDDKDIKKLITKVIKNGFDKFGYRMLRKYRDKLSNMTIIEMGILGKLDGYNYLSVFKFDEATKGKVYLTYSPPMDEQLKYNADAKMYKNNLTISDLSGYTLIPKLNNYTNEKENAPGKEFSCGYPCLSDEDKPLMYDDEKQYMCGSVGYPTVQTPTRFAVYHIAEKT